MNWFDLTEYKRQRLADVNRRTAEIVNGGFVHGGVRVRTTGHDLVFYHQLGELSSLLATTVIPAADDLDAPLTVTTLTFGAFVGAVKSWLRQVYADEAVIKAAIRTAADRAAVDAVVDQR